VSGITIPSNKDGIDAVFRGSITTPIDPDDTDRPRIAFELGQDRSITPAWWNRWWWKTFEEEKKAVWVEAMVGKFNGQVNRTHFYHSNGHVGRGGNGQLNCDLAPTSRFHPQPVTARDRGTVPQAARQRSLEERAESFL
jgi:hypothetical protein